MIKNLAFGVSLLFALIGSAILWQQSYFFKQTCSSQNNPNQTKRMHTHRVGNRRPNKVTSNNLQWQQRGNCSAFASPPSTTGRVGLLYEKSTLLLAENHHTTTHSSRVGILFRWLWCCISAAASLYASSFPIAVEGQTLLLKRHRLCQTNFCQAVFADVCVLLYEHARTRLGWVEKRLSTRRLFGLLSALLIKSANSTSVLLSLFTVTWRIHTHTHTHLRT